MGPFLLAVLICVVIVLYAVAGLHSISAKDWLLTGLPAWLQGVGTVGAAYVAWHAFSTWREQDAGRRKGMVAEAVVGSVHKIARDLELARYWRIKKGMNQASCEEAVREAHAGLVAVQSELVSLERYRGLTEHYFGGGIMDGIGDIESAVFDFRQALRVMEFAVRAGELDGDGLARFWDTISVNVMRDVEDELSKKLQRGVTKVEEVLVPHLTGK